MTDPPAPARCSKCGDPMKLEQIERRLAVGSLPGPHPGYYTLAWCPRCGRVIEPEIPLRTAALVWSLKGLSEWLIHNNRLAACHSGASCTMRYTRTTRWGSSGADDRV
jgi:hypothetical protein